MCGRFSIIVEEEILKKRFGVIIPEQETLFPRFNAAPTQNLPVITNLNPSEIHLFRWGLIPFWAKDIKIGNKLINARGETLTEKPSFKNAYTNRRCLVLADGFYEWKRVGKNKIPMRITLKNEEPFAIAGLWENWKSPSGEFIKSFTVITTEPNELMSGIHNRMPVILPREIEKDWLDNSLTTNELNGFLQPFQSEKMKAFQVSSSINSPANDNPSVIFPIQNELKL
ncbi:MAG: SOS response-associated peptidase [Calditrichaeota bacterium]|nr:MAG: SOS response-associated peptidase [Calditrichota bacterium]